ncbi:5-formyltetrahydrofolate cyclo-ligase [Salibacterium aidingense]|uniref:5-formyltetrahydrofolate cyclo-ligase n=1 Tax=Salibacterium aidingense TaxID=384933 RepID=UPI00041F9150|nr:5-formyltetrahydrofolate cyclo-ligase [Salibacterium aidingense]
MKEKREIRLHIRNTFQRLTEQDMEQKGAKICDQLFASSLWQNASTIALTMATKNEVNTRPMIEKGWQEGKCIAVPKADPFSYTLDFYQITSFQETKEDFAGIFEPDPAFSSFIPPDMFDLIIVPGMAFDKEKYRIGFGGGYYDRFLKNIAVPACAVLCEFQLFERLPREKHDIPLDFLFTENKII